MIFLLFLMLFCGCLFLLLLLLFFLGGGAGVKVGYVVISPVSQSVFIFGTSSMFS